MSTRSDTPVFCDESGTRSAFLQWSARAALLLVLLLCAGLALTLETQVRLPGLGRLLPSADIGVGRPAGPAMVAVPSDPKTHPTVREGGLITTDTEDRRVPATDTEKRFTTTSRNTTAVGKTRATTPPAATTRPTRNPRAQATDRSTTPPGPESTTGPQHQQSPPGQTKKSASPPAQPTNPADSNANGNGQSTGLAKGKDNKPEVPPALEAAPSAP